MFSSTELSQKLKQLRKARGLTQEQLVKELENTQHIAISIGTIKSYEAAKTAKDALLSMRTEYLYAFASFYGVSVDWLLGLTNDPRRRPCAADELPLTPENLDFLYLIAANPEKNHVWGVFVNDMIEFSRNPEAFISHFRLQEALDIQSDTDQDVLQRTVNEWTSEEHIKEMGYFPLKPNEATDHFRNQIAFQLQNYLKEKYPTQKEG